MTTDFDSTLGATYIGVTATACLYGISTLHGYTYWNRQTRDSVIIKIFISSLWLMDTVKLICATHVGYRLLITEYENDPAALFNSTWSINTQFLLTALVIFGAQALSAYYTSESCELVSVSWATPCGTRVMAIVATFFAFMQLGFGITLSSLAWVYWDIREIDEHLWVAIAWMGSATVSSVIIAYNLSALLVSVYVPVQGATDLISGLLRYLVHTGFLTSILTLVNLLGFFFTGQYVRIAVNFPLGTLHIIVILAILNARPNDATNSSTIEEYEFGTTRRKAESIDDLGQVALKGSLRIGKLSIKIPSRLLRKEPPITVLVQQDTHVIGISVIEDDNQNPSLRQHEDSDETESIETSVGLAKSHTPTI